MESMTFRACSACRKHYRYAYGAGGRIPQYKN